MKINYKGLNKLLHMIKIFMSFCLIHYWLLIFIFRYKGALLLKLLLLLLLLLLSRSSHVQLCATPQMAAHQAPPSLGFSRQEHWSRLPFPSPMRESEVSQSCLTPSNLMDCGLPGSSVQGILQARVLEWGAIAFSVVNRSVVSNSLLPSRLQPARLLCPRDSPGKSTGVGCCVLLQGVFPAQGSDPLFLHCIGRWVLYHQHHLGRTRRLQTLLNQGQPPGGKRLKG